MGHIIIATPTLSDLAELGAGSAAAAMPVDNLQSRQPGEVWRATDLGNAYVTIDLQTAATWNFIGLLFTNATSAATWRIRAAASAAGVTSAPSYDSGWLTLWPHAAIETDWGYMHGLLWLGANAQTLRYLRIDVNDAGNGASYFEAGRLYVANAWQPPRNLQFGNGIGFVDSSPADLMLGGQLMPEPRPSHRVLNFTLNQQSADVMFENALQIDRRRGAGRDVFVWENPDDPRRALDCSIYGLSRELQPLVNTAYALREKRYQIEEMIP